MSAPARHTSSKRTLSALIRAAMTADSATPFASLTCYDATTARWLARAGVQCLLVGDTAAEMVLGFPRTIDMPLDVLLALTAGVKRGSDQGGGAVVMGDMPFMSYQASPDDAVSNAGRFLTEGLADIVKLEVDSTFAPLVDRIVRAGVPICAHVGSRPQRVAITGYSAAGRTAAEAERIVADARSMQDAGCSMLLVEAVPDAVTARIMDIAKVPVIGIGAGSACHGQVLVLQDLLGLTDTAPAFAEPLESLGQTIKNAGERWVAKVAARRAGPSPYKMRDAAPGGGGGERP
jgi:3-methyl-2-oxobutanoate hydroxymethyltransferase